MLWGAVALVPRQPVAWKLRVHLPESRIAMNLCHHACGCNRDASRIAADDCPLSATKPRHIHLAVAVNQGKVNGHGRPQLRQSLPHRQPRSLTNVDPINRGHIHFSNRTSQRDRSNFHSKSFAIGFLELFGVFESAKLVWLVGKRSGKNHGGSGHGSKKRSATYLIHSGQETRARGPCFSLQLPTTLPTRLPGLRAHFCQYTKLRPANASQTRKSLGGANCSRPRPLIL